MADAKKKDPKRVMGKDCPKFRVSFPRVFKAEAFEDQAPKFTCTMLFKSTQDLTVLKKAAHAAKVDKWGADKSKWPKKLRSPFRDGNEKEDLEGYKGMIYITASNKHRPEVVGRDLSPITEESDEFYAGCYARATLRAFAYDAKGNKGVSFSLENIQKVGEGERFSGRVKAEDSFDALDEEEDEDTDSGDDSEEDDDAGF